MQGLSYFPTTKITPSEPATGQPYNDDIKDKSDPLYILSTLLSNRSATYMELNKLEEALRDAEEVVRIRPHWVKVSVIVLNVKCYLSRLLFDNCDTVCIYTGLFQAG